MAAAQIIERPVDNPDDARWRAGHAVLVTTGDMIDKGPRALDVLADPAAPKGREFAAQLTAAHIQPADVGKCRGEFGEFLCSLSFAARVGDWFFSHGGNSGGRRIEDLAIDLDHRRPCTVGRRFRRCREAQPRRDVSTLRRFAPTARGLYFGIATGARRSRTWAERRPVRSNPSRVWRISFFESTRQAYERIHLPPNVPGSGCGRRRLWSGFVPRR